MAHFYGSLQGARGEATRLGHKEIRSHTRGWNVGIKIVGKINATSGEDEFHVYLTSGSNNHKLSKYLGVFTAKDLDKDNSHD